MEESPRSKISSRLQRRDESPDCVFFTIPLLENTGTTMKGPPIASFAPRNNGQPAKAPRNFMMGLEVEEYLVSCSRAFHLHAGPKDR